MFDDKGNNPYASAKGPACSKFSGAEPQGQRWFTNLVFHTLTSFGLSMIALALAVPYLSEGGFQIYRINDSVYLIFALTSLFVACTTLISSAVGNGLGRRWVRFVPFGCIVCFAIGYLWVVVWPMGAMFYVIDLSNLIAYFVGGSALLSAMVLAIDSSKRRLWMSVPIYVVLMVLFGVACWNAM